MGMFTHLWTETDTQTIELKAGQVQNVHLSFTVEHVSNPACLFYNFVNCQENDGNLSCI